MKHIFSSIFAFVVSINAHAESFIPYKGGKLVLFALPGCGGPTEPHDRMYGVWEKAGGGGGLFCWKYNEVISIYYIEGEELHLAPEDVVIENDGTVDDHEPSSKKHSKLPAELSANY